MSPTRIVGILAAALALALPWWWLASGDKPPAPASPGPSASADPAAAFAKGAPSTPAGEAAPATLSVQPVAKPSGVVSGAIVRPQLPPVDSYKLTRSLPSEQGQQDIQFEGRIERVMGTRSVADERGPQIILITRDEASGTLSYWQSGLRFALKSGEDYESFIRANPRFSRRFVNSDYADVAMDAGDVAEAYRSLSGDPRVLSVRLLSLARQDKAK